MRHELRSVVAYAALVLTLGAGLPAMAAVHEVTVRNIEFDPPEVIAAPGDTVHWTWESGSHTVTSGTDCTYDEQYFDDPMNTGDPEFEFVIPDGPDQIPYFCRPHCGSGMTGLITIEAGVPPPVPTGSQTATIILAALILVAAMVVIARGRKMRPA